MLNLWDCTVLSNNLTKEFTIPKRSRVVKQRDFIRCFIIFCVIFLAFVFVLVLNDQPVLAQILDKSVDSSFSSTNDTELKKPSWLGLATITITPEISNIIQYHGEYGILVTDVTPNGPAFKGGLKGGNQSVSFNETEVKIGGDIILSADNNEILNDGQFRQYYRNKAVGEDVTLEILRDGKNKVMNLTVGENPSLIYEDDMQFQYPDKINFSDFQNVNFGIGIKYPKSWEPSVETNSIFFRSNPENSSDIARDYLRIDVIPGESNSSKLVAYTGANPAKTVKPTALFSIGPYTGDLAIYSYLDAQRGRLQLMKASAIINGTGYLFSYYAQDSNFDDYLHTIERMINSFRVLNITKVDNADLGVRFKYPSEWVLQESSELGVRFKYPSEWVLWEPESEEIVSLDEGWRGFDLINERNNTSIGLKISPQYDTTAEAREVFNQYINHLTDHLKYPIVKLASKVDHDREGSIYDVNFTRGDPEIGTLFGEINVKLSNNRIYSAHYSTREVDYREPFGIVNQILNSMEPFTHIRYENRLLEIISYYPSDWKSYFDSNVLYNPSYSGSLKFCQLVDQKEGDNNDANLGSNICDINSTLPDQSQNSEISLSTTLGEKINASKIILLKNETIPVLFPDQLAQSEQSPDELTQSEQKTETRQVNMMIVSYNLTGKSYIANYTESIYPGDVSYLSTAENIINSLKLIDYYPVSEITTDYQNSDFVVRFPRDWSTYEYHYGLVLSPNNVTNGGISIGPVLRNYTDINQIVSEDLRSLLPNAKMGYGLTNSTIFKQNNITGYKIQFNDTTTTYLNTYLISRNNTYPIYYRESRDTYFNYLPQVESLIKSFLPINNVDFKFTGYHVGKLLTGIAVNPNNNMLYVADGLLNVVHVRDGANNKISDIPVGIYPEGIAVDPNLNTIYVANSESNSISIIDGAKNIVNSTVGVGEEPLIVTVNPFTHMAYVGDAITHVLYRIDGINHEVKQIWTGGKNITYGVGLAINEITDNVYVANPDTKNVTVVDGKTMNILSNYSIPDATPTDIAINSLSNMGYVLTTSADGYDNFVYEIDLSANITDSPTKRVYISDARYPNVVSIDRLRNLVYVTDYGTSKIYVIDISNHYRMSHKALNDDPPEAINVDPLPAYLSINHVTGITYVSTTAGTLSTIDNDAMEIRYGIRYHINSNISGSIFCNGKRISNNDYATYLANEQVACNIVSTNYFFPILSTSWKLHNKDTYQNTAWPAQHLVRFIVTEHDDIYVSTGDIDSFIRQWGSIISLATVISVVLIASIPTILFHGKRWRTLGKYVLKRDEILGINASVIVGVLVFLSLEGFNESQQSEITFVTASIVFPFAISVITTILGRNYFATRLMVAGFVNLMISIILIVSLRYRP